MRPAHFEIIHPDYHDDGNPYSATLLPDERIPDEPDQHRIRRLRNWLIALAHMIGCLVIIGYIIGRLFYSEEAPGFQERIVWTGVSIIVLISFMVVVYRLSRALGNSLGMSILYVFLSTFMIHFEAFTIPLGTVIITFLLYVQAQNALLDQQPDETDSF